MRKVGDAAHVQTIYSRYGKSWPGFLFLFPDTR
jgi:hypothetical protein